MMEVSVAVLVAGVVFALVVGFAVGFCTFKRSLCWCPERGSILRCPDCVDHPFSGAIAAAWLQCGRPGRPGDQRG